MRAPAQYLTILLSAAAPYAMAEAATVSGSVKGANGAPLKGAFVSAQNDTTKMAVSVLSGTDGKYRIENLPDGSYRLQAKALGYSSEAGGTMTLAGNAPATRDFALKSGKVAWNEISQYQGQVLFPAALGNQVLRGKDVLVGRCFACHGFQTRMASVKRDADGWRDRVNYMRGAMHFFLDSEIGRAHV